MSTQNIIHLHGLFVILSLVLFSLRGYWMLRECPALQARWVKIAPHIIDTMLLLTALWAAWILFWSHGSHPTFMTVKIIGLIVYIGLGIVALKRGKTKAIRLTAFIAALCVYAYLMAVGITMRAVPFAS
ncbi:MAG TPA: regulator SirB [bacterium]|nr:regulator SirB [bacterium]